MSVRATLCCLAVALLAPALVQVPLGIGHLPENQWNLDELPNLNHTDNLIFETVHSLLQHWPNTRMRNGHNIVPGLIPKGTLLYHGAYQNQLPSGPEWVATDPEHSYLFCRPGFLPKPLSQGCWHLTLAATRPLKVVYFDGSSAAKIGYGTMDTQDLLVWGKAGTDDMVDERLRIIDLCDWGKSFGVDGFVRMEMDFEVMLCSFNSGVDVVTFANLPDRNDDIGRIASQIASFEVMNSGSWHNHFPGETRVQLDLSGLVSFYDTQLVPSLVPIRAVQERWDHRVRNASSEDVSAVRSRLEEVLVRPEGLSSGVDWRTLVQVIVDRFAGRLELIRHLLDESTTDPDEILDIANNTQAQLRTMLIPYILLSVAPTDPSDKGDLEWAVPVYKLCATTHTSFMESYLVSMTDSEKLILQAIRGTSREICRVITRMWVAGVYAGLDNGLSTKESVDDIEVIQLWRIWSKELSNLMGWLDWNVWVKCDPGCSSDEMCYLPTWPVGFPRRKRTGRPTDPDRPQAPPEKPSGFELRGMIRETLTEDMSKIVRPEEDEWIRPQPRCVRRFAPYIN